jgi:hypothetical protein
MTHLAPLWTSRLQDDLPSFQKRASMDLGSLLEASLEFLRLIRESVPYCRISSRTVGVCSRLSASVLALKEFSNPTETSGVCPNPNEYV